MRFIPIYLLSIFIVEVYNNPAIVVSYLSRQVGNGYCYGASGERMTEAVLARLVQVHGKDRVNPDYQRDHNMGKIVYDCSGLVMRAFNEVGIRIYHGATTAWKGTKWSKKGPISQLPQGKVAILYMADGDTMTHTGVYTGGNYCIHAKGLKFGVVKETMDKTKWTHFGIPDKLYK